MHIGGNNIIINGQQRGALVTQSNEPCIWYPMLAQTWNKVSKKHRRFPLIAQPKLNGMRCIKVGNKFFTRTGKEIVSVPSLLQMTNTIFGDLPLDGELYYHGMSFEENQSICRPTVNIAEDSRMQYHIFDANIKKGAEIRINRVLWHMVEFFNTHPKYFTNGRIQIVTTVSVVNNDELHQWEEQFIHQGFEGIMLRHPEAPYEEDKRSYHLLKLKRFYDTEATVIDFLPGMGRLYGTLGALRGRLIDPTFNNITVDVGSGFTDAERNQIWKNRERYLFEKFTLKYQEKTKHGVPRFPTFAHWRNAE